MMVPPLHRTDGTTSTLSLCLTMATLGDALHASVGEMRTLGESPGGTPGLQGASCVGAVKVVPEEGAADRMEETHLAIEEDPPGEDPPNPEEKLRCGIQRSRSPCTGPGELSARVRPL